MGHLQLDKTQLIGTTEAGEVAFNLDVFDRLYQGNIIITKRLTGKLVEQLVKHAKKIILHVTCTGYGGTVIEPMVPDINTTYNNLKKLIECKFPVDHIVLRIDPVIPTEKGIMTAMNVVERFSDLGIKRVRYSIIDMYSHVKDRFNRSNLPLPFETFHCNYDKRLEIHNLFLQKGQEHGFDVEVCGEPGIGETPCLSQKDIDILKLSGRVKLIGNSEQRKSCKCPANKKELIKGKPSRCSNKCLYCFWMDYND